MGRRVEQGTIHEWEEVRSEYHDPGADPSRSLVTQVLKTIDHGELARSYGVSERHIARLRNDNQMRSPCNAPPESSHEFRL
jgi:hypothetical protein